MFQQMKYFIAVVEHHNFTRAALDCNISQSAISQQIKELENTVGVKLLNRQGRSFTLTPAGEHFYRRALEITRETTELIDETVKIANQQQQFTLRLGYLIDFGAKEFLKAVAEFSQKYPGVNVKINSGTHEQLFQLLREDQIDLNFSDQRRALSNEYHNEFLIKADFVAVLPSSRIMSKEYLTTTDLANLPCILVVGSVQKDEEEKYYREVLGIKSRFLVATTIDEAQMMVVANQGYFVVNSRTKDIVNQSIVKTVPLYNGDTLLRQNYYAYWKNNNSGYYVEKFAEILKKQFK
ncbi:LysR family transcriptional regulator [Limosilactobacillus sp. STM2_1]|uniref:LysR family transcriptional regulator n=1 Tax=Limosilactobacillus rudii TaxID=2759755 RepID=A0A7W3UJE8_9LACO|nr:LysR family transcriptional regulator [Limosilactobacillus rudii]MBB1078476.1 LysR family transcriptional regulator [Limosilactobacillus rudii]MBB1096606.1 LysR family transcriptional regulator [Limosilactobacillus rudii]MCD7134198.1 LysR family transcriptional regulator [Limosilactobacillus rudii]